MMDFTDPNDVDRVPQRPKAEEDSAVVDVIIVVVALLFGSGFAVGTAVSRIFGCLP
jgi:hypothetical protein